MSLPCTFRFDSLLVEVLLSLMLSLPRAPQPQLFFHSLLTQLLRAAPRLAPFYFKAADTLFKSIDRVDVEARERLLEWLAFHLSNFQVNREPRVNFIFLFIVFPPPVQMGMERLGGHNQFA